MGDEDQRAGEGGERLLEPLDGGDVQVVGGLVEEQQAGLHHHRARQRHALPQASGELRDHGIQVLAPDARIDERHAQHAHSAQHGGGDPAGAASVVFRTQCQVFLIQVPRCTAHIPKTEDVARGLVQHFEVRVRSQLRVQVGSQLGKMIVEQSERSGAVTLHGNPQLERIGAARALEAAPALVAAAFGRRVKEVGRLLPESRVQLMRSTNQQDAG